MSKKRIMQWWIRGVPSVQTMIRRYLLGAASHGRFRAPLRAFAASSAPAQRRGEAISPDGTRIVYHVHSTGADEGAPLMLIHGWACGSSDWGAFPKLLCRFRPVVTFDARGTGESDKPAGDYTIQMLAEDAAAVARAACASPSEPGGAVDDEEPAGDGLVHLLGLSMGGMVAQSLAISDPSLVRSLTLCATTPGGKEAEPPPQPSFFELFEGYDAKSEADQRRCAAAFLVSSLPEEWCNRAASTKLLMNAVNKWVETPGGRSEAGIHSQRAAMMRFNASRGLAGVTCPALVIHGDVDPVVPVENALLLKSLLGNRRGQAKLLLFNGVGHLPHIQEPQELATATELFLLKQEAGEYWPLPKKEKKSTRQTPEFRPTSIGTAAPSS